MRIAIALPAILLLSRCQSFQTHAFTVPESAAATIRELVANTSASLSLRPCEDYKVKVENSDLCFGGRLGGSSVTVAGYKAPSAYTVKIGLYSAGRPEEDWSALIAKYKDALAVGLPGVPITMDQKAEPIRSSTPVQDEAVGGQRAR